MKTDQLTEKIIGCAIEVHKHLGPGLLESAYEDCLVYELHAAGLNTERQKPIPVVYKNLTLACGYRIDILVAHSVVLELKSVEAFNQVHEAQILTYMKMAKVRTGLLINFNVNMLKNGLKRYSM